MRQARLATSALRGTLHEVACGGCPPKYVAHVSRRSAWGAPAPPAFCHPPLFLPHRQTHYLRTSTKRFRHFHFTSPHRYLIFDRPPPRRPQSQLSCTTIPTTPIALARSATNTNDSDRVGAEVQEMLRKPTTPLALARSATNTNDSDSLGAEGL